MNSFKNSGKLKAVTFSYDDGVTQDIHLIELLNKYGLKCTFNLNSGLMLNHNTYLIRENQRVAHYKIEPKEISEIYKNHEIAVHTVTHPSLVDLTEKEVIAEVENDRKALEQLAGYKIYGMAYPGGVVNNSVAEIIKNNTEIKYCRTVASTGNFDVQDNLYEFNPTVYHLDFDKMMELGERFVNLNPDKPQIFYIWGHAYELDYGSDYWVKLENFFKLISGKNDIFYGTNTEVLL